MRFYSTISIYGKIGEYPNRSIDVIQHLSKSVGRIDILLQSIGGSIDDAFEIIDYINDLPEKRRSELRLFCLASASSASLYFVTCLDIQIYISKLFLSREHEPSFSLNENDLAYLYIREYKDCFKNNKFKVLSYIDISKCQNWRNIIII